MYEFIYFLQRKEAQESTRMQLDKQEREGQQGVVEPGHDPAGVSAEKMYDNAIVADVSRSRQ